MIDEGHIIGNHTVNHKSMPDLNTDTIKKKLWIYIQKFMKNITMK